MADRVFDKTIKIDNYKMLHDAYNGSGIFSYGQGIQQHARESIENYIRRKSLAYYWNYTRPVVDATVDPIFKDEIKRDYKDSVLFQLFLNNADHAGTTLQEYLRRVAVMAKLYGVVYVLVNNTENVAETRDEDIANGNYPFVTEIMPDDVMSWKLDENGAITEFVFRQVGEYTEAGKQYIYHRWDRETWSVHKTLTMTSEDMTHQGVHGLGVVPIVQWFGRATPPSTIKPSSEFISIAQTNYSLYQLCSWHTQLLADQAFNILTYPDDGNLADNLTIGTDNLLAYPAESSKAPAFISPDASPANMLTDQMDRHIQEIYRMSGMDSVVGVQSAKSGVAKQWDFQRINQRLADFAVQCESAERKIVQLFELWTGETTDFTCEYPRDFSINDVTESLGQAQSAIDLNLGSNAFTVEVAKKVLEAYMPNIEPDIYDNIVKEVEESTAQSKQDREYSNLLNHASMLQALGGDDEDDGQDEPKDRHLN
ncbi:hypothetical protein [Veillonella sp. 3310]|uniref:hypothetical protein n=1 Tax=Veillonella sp. 3310 TaxID=2490956 RepID=UPI000FD67538|nr:hypothetical protein [Veillonella sp. 3310]